MKKTKFQKELEKELKEKFQNIDTLKEVILNPDLTEKEKLAKIDEFEHGLPFLVKFAKTIEEKRKGPMFGIKKING